MYIPSSIFVLSNIPGYWNTKFCLETNPWRECSTPTTSGCARQDGGTIDVWDCDMLPTFNEFVHRDLVSWWHMDESGVLVSGLSGMCLAHPSSILRSDSTEGMHGGLCIRIRLSIHAYQEQSDFMHRTQPIVIY